MGQLQFVLQTRPRGNQKRATLYREQKKTQYNTNLSNCGAFISHFCCSGTVCQFLASRTIAAASISPYPNE